MTATATGDPRLLRFFPASGYNLKRLTRDQVRHYNTHGYAKPFRIYSKEEADGNRHAFDEMLDAIVRAKDGRDAYSINGYHTQSASIWDIVTHPLILDHVEDILGPNIVAWGTHYFCKMPGDPRSVPWHQDASYWPLTPSRTVTVWLAIDDADRGNGAMKALNRSHLQGHLPFENAAAGEAVVLNQKVINPERFGPPEYFEMKAGEISLHSDLLVHGSDPNMSDRRRCGLTIRYATTDVRSTAGWNANSILCRGTDPEKYWGNIPRPAGDSIEKQSWQQQKKVAAES